jgi:hypothetical protein
LLAQVGDLHWHLCLDGAEPAATVHVADNRDHHTNSALEVAHTDRDVTPGSLASAKKSVDDNGTTPALLTVVGEVASDISRGVHYVSVDRTILTPGVWHSHPPARGPPARA